MISQISSVDDMGGTEQYNNPVYSNDLRDHIDRRNSVVEVSWWTIQHSECVGCAMLTCCYYLVPGADNGQPGLTCWTETGRELTSSIAWPPSLALYSCHHHSQESRTGNNYQQSVSILTQSLFTKYPCEIYLNRKLLQGYSVSLNCNLYGDIVILW